jgi:hypothetical protein
MNFKFLIILLAIVALMMPLASAGVHWENQNGETITSAYIGDTVRLDFDTVVNSTNPPGYADEWIVVWMQKTDPYTGGIVDLSGYDKYPSYVVQVYGGTNSTIIPQWTGHNQSFTRWVGWSNFTITDPYVTSYTGRLVSISYLNPSWLNYYGNATLTVSKNPLLLTNLNDFVDGIGGAGLRYLLGVIIIGILAFIPFFLMRELNVFIEIIMIILGVGISYLIGLFDLWVVFALALGSLAVFLMLRDRVGG